MLARPPRPNCWFLLPSKLWRLRKLVAATNRVCPNHLASQVVKQHLLPPDLLAQLQIAQAEAAAAAAAAAAALPAGKTGAPGAATAGAGGAAQGAEGLLRTASVRRGCCLGQHAHAGLGVLQRPTPAVATEYGTHAATLTSPNPPEPRRTSLPC